MAEDSTMNLAFDIAEEVADLEQTDPLDLPPLNDTIDIDSLERCMGSVDYCATMQFLYCHYRITVKGDGSLFIETNGTSMGTDSQWGEDEWGKEDR